LAVTDTFYDLIFGIKKRSFFSDGQNNVLLNVLKDFSRVNRVDVTEHAIEEGLNVNDNIDNKLTTYSLKAILTDWDIESKDPVFYKFPENITERLETFKKWRDEKTLVTYYGDEDIESLCITSIEDYIDSSIGDGVGLSISMQKLNIVESQNQGTKNKGEVDLIEEEVNVSL